ncbi:MAG: hypothetical protein LH478_01430 [Chitinophagaceae bacterium]|nr:hypothetical protein [Chitinophagaceae bacterium]
MNLEKLDALVKNMSNDQYLKFEGAVFDLLKENKLFTGNELTLLEKKIQLKKKLEREQVLITNN